MGFWRKGNELERELRRARPEPRAEFVEATASRVERAHRPRPYRLGVAVAVSIAALVSFGAMGGLGFASSASHSVAKASKIVKVSATHSAVKSVQTVKTTSGGGGPDHDEYCDGPNCGHHHHKHHHHDWCHFWWGWGWKDWDSWD